MIFFFIVCQTLCVEQYRLKEIAFIPAYEHASSAWILVFKIQFSQLGVQPGLGFIVAIAICRVADTFNFSKCGMLLRVLVVGTGTPDDFSQCS